MRGQTFFRGNVYVSVLHQFFKAMVMFASRMSAAGALAWLEHCRGREGWGQGVLMCHILRWHQQRAPLPSLPSWLQY